MARKSRLLKMPYVDGRLPKILIGIDDVDTQIDIIIFAKAYFERVPKKWNMKKGACIASACLTADVFKKLGYDASPLPVITHIMNKRLHERYESGDTEGIDHTNLIIGHPDDVEENDRWKGHLVTLLKHKERGASFIIDASLMQAQRYYIPQVPDMAALPFSPKKDYFGAKENILIAGCEHKDNETTMIYFLLSGPNSASWKNSPDAKQERRKMTVSRIVDSMRQQRHMLNNVSGNENTDFIESNVLPSEKWIIVSDT